MEFRDRKEFLEFHGEYKINCIQKMKINILISKTKKIQLGSMKWHILQERMSVLPDIGFYARKRNAFYMASLNCGNKLYIHTGVIINYPQNVKFGHRVSINRNTIITAKSEITIGNNVSIGPQVIINSGNHKFDNTKIPINQQGHNIKPIIIEDDVWIGAGVSILAGVTIGKGSVIGAGAVVTKDLEEYGVYVGVPAKLIKKRSID